MCRAGEREFTVPENTVVAPRFEPPIRPVAPTSAALRNCKEQNAVSSTEPTAVARHAMTARGRYRSGSPQ
jgi:hypothetical protein